jgi:class 3 adenylate cyclase
MLDSYSRLVERKTRELEQEKERAERLLLNIMPRRVYEELREFGTTTPQAFDEVSVLLLDFAGFTEMAIAREPTVLIAELNDVFTSFDRIVEHHRCERIKTIGDAYMAVAGAPDADPEHAIHMAHVALRIRRFLERRNANSPTRWHPRIGIGCGPAIGSIVGVQKYVYDIFGPAVNLASRLENLADPMQILVCPATADRIRDEFIVADAGVADLRGFGEVGLFALVEEPGKAADCTRGAVGRLQGIQGRPGARHGNCFRNRSWRVASAARLARWRYHALEPQVGDQVAVVLVAV